MKYKCTFCGEKKTTSNFKVDKRTKSGRSKWCNECLGDAGIVPENGKKRDLKKKPVKAMPKKKEATIKGENVGPTNMLCPHCMKSIFLEVSNVQLIVRTNL